MQTQLSRKVDCNTACKRDIGTIMWRETCLVLYGDSTLPWATLRAVVSDSPWTLNTRDILMKADFNKPQHKS